MGIRYIFFPILSRKQLKTWACKCPSVLICMILFMNWMTDETHDQESALLKEILPPRLWRALARNGITTMKEVRRLYPEELLQMPDIGPRTFRKIEALLFPGQYYVPHFRDDLKNDALDGKSKYRPALWRALMELQREDRESAQAGSRS